MGRKKIWVGKKCITQYIFYQYKNIKVNINHNSFTWILLGWLVLNEVKPILEPTRVIWLVLFQADQINSYVMCKIKLP